MTVNLVSGGLVSVEDGIKAAEEYAPARKVRIELKFDVAEGADGAEALDIVLDMANARLDQQLGRKPRTGRVVEVGGSRPGDNPSTQGTAEAAVDEANAGKRTRRTKAQIEADNAAAAARTADPAAITDDAVPQSDPAAIQDDATTSEPTGSAGGEQTSADPAAIEDWDVPAEPVSNVTDADLNAAVQKRNGELQATLGDAAPPKIRALIGSFNPDPTKPFNLRQIPADQRPAFLEKLKALA